MTVSPWGFRYLDLLQCNTISAFYARLAVVTTCYLQDVQQKQGYSLRLTDCFSEVSVRF